VPHATILTWLNLPNTNPLRIDDSAAEQLEQPFFAKLNSSFVGQVATKFQSVIFGNWAIGKLVANQLNYRCSFITRSAKMFSHFLLFVVMLLVAKRLVEVVILIQQRLGRQINTGSETTPGENCLSKVGEPTAVEHLAG
jgi:hypothetical protein